MSTASTTGPLTLSKADNSDNANTFLNTTMDTNIDNINAAFNATTGHDHDGTDSKKIPAGSLAAGAVDAVAALATALVDALYPWHVALWPWVPFANTNWATQNVGSLVFGAWVGSSGAQNDEISWKVPLAAGTWDVTIIHHKNTDRGIYSVQFDDVAKGTIDGYNGSESLNQESSVTGITVATTALTEVSLKMLTKNASSSSYYGIISAVFLTRTA